jgi:predicted molibdopterin-dependent oxidoreductase YjgC
MAIANCRTWPVPSACATCATATEGDSPTISRARNGDQPNPRWMPKDESNPYFTYDPSKCIVCSRCVRACEEVQGTFALTIEGRGFDSRVSPGMARRFPVVGLRQLRRLRAGLPDGDACRRNR